MVIIGVTGGIGAGKSSVSRILMDLGAEVIDADKISHEVVEPGKLAWAKIVDLFGEEILMEDRSIDRKKLADKVFNDNSLRKRLEAIVHAEVIRAFRQRIQDLAQEDYEGVVVLDVPIPVEHGFLDTVDQVWVVTSPEEVRIQRVMSRSGLSRGDAVSRIKSQLSQEDYIKLADQVIANDGSLKELKEKVENLFNAAIK